MSYAVVLPNHYNKTAVSLLRQNKKTALALVSNSEFASVKSSSISDTFNVSSSVYLFMQNYFLEDCIASDYVGVVVTT